MPKYNYRCDSCKQEFEVRHPMGEVLGECIFCQSGVVVKVPSLSFTVRNNTGAGALVKDFIETTRRSVSDEKAKLKEEFYD